MKWSLKIKKRKMISDILSCSEEYSKYELLSFSTFEVIYIFIELYDKQEYRKKESSYTIEDLYNKGASDE